MTEETMASRFETAAWHNEVAMVDLCFLGKYALSELPQKHGCKVVLTGEGSDEHFAGYSELLTDFLREPDYSWPTTVLPEDKRMIEFIAREYRTDFTAANLSDIRPVDPPTAKFARKQINNVSFVGFMEFVSSIKHFAPWTARSFGTIDRRTAAVHNTLDGVTRNLVANKWHPLHSALYLWTRCTLANLILVVLGERMEMAHSVEGRQPFLDHHLCEYVMSLPPSMKFRYEPETNTFNEKWILKEAMKPFIPEEMYKRRKHPFSAPMKYRVDGPIHRLFSRLITKESINSLGFLEWKDYETIVEDAMCKHDMLRMRELIMVAQFVTIGHQFGVRKAEPGH
jgi:asparagine synthase (glutamine-hydrolysing)